MRVCLSVLSSVLGLTRCVPLVLRYRCHGAVPTTTTTVLPTAIEDAVQLESRCAHGFTTSVREQPPPCAPLSPSLEPPPHARVIISSTRRNPIVWASLLSRNVLPGVVNIHRSTHELLDRILDGQAVPDLEDGAIPVLVSAFDVTRCEIWSRGAARFVFILYTGPVCYRSFASSCTHHMMRH